MKWRVGSSSRVAFNAGTKRENLEEFPAQVHNKLLHNHQHTKLHFAAHSMQCLITIHYYTVYYTMHCAVESVCDPPAQSFP